MKIAYLGAGTWGFSLANLLAEKGHNVTLWTSKQEEAQQLELTRIHKKLPQGQAHPHLHITSDLKKCLEGAHFIIESVTSAGIRPVFEQVKLYYKKGTPIIITSKGIEQNTELLLPEVILDILGPETKNSIACLSGPSHAEEVILKIPTSVVSSSYNQELMYQVLELFVTPYFRVYPNKDIQGVAFGGAMKNIIAIACGISDGLGFGDNTKAALMTRGLHEIKKLSIVKQCEPETLNGLAGLGDLCVTCLSTLSRNYRFGHLIATGKTASEAKELIGMAVEGMYTCVSAFQLAHHHKIQAPITDAIYHILYQNLSPQEAVKALLTRHIKDESL
jgi:glycerol-3-phosphate dehydrogenase (NAD(P)+)